MDSFVWDSHFITGLKDVDEQHHHLVDVVNHFGETITNRRGASFDDVEKVLNELTAYTQYHFQEEEMLMDTARLDPRHVRHHRAEHKNFLREVTRMHAAITASDPNEGKSLLKFLIYWLAYHILGSDQSMAKQVLSIRNGSSAADAYVAEERAKDGAVEPLLHALNGLFHQVSERNRELIALNQSLEERVADRTKELAIANRRLEDIASTDALTGLPNRRHAMMRLAQAWEESINTNYPLTCMMIDADGFKQINDNYGHDAGDEVLRQLSRSLQHVARTDDIVCRLGGDEFFVICTQTDLEGAALLAEKFRSTISVLHVPTGGGEWRGSISVGVAMRKEEMDHFDQLIKAADDGVYRAKRNGRNCVAVADRPDGACGAP